LPGFWTATAIVAASGLDEGDEPFAVVGRFQFGGGRVGFRLQVVGNRHRIGLAPFGEVVVRLRRAGAHGAHVDRLGEAQRQFPLGARAALLDDDLGGDVAPVDDDAVCHVENSPGAFRWNALPLFAIPGGNRGALFRELL
jgi:hypothetical protein